MKFLARCIVILLVFIICGIIVDQSVLSFSNKLLEKSTRLEDEVYNEDWESAKATLSEINDDWASVKRYWLMILDHETLDNIDRYLTEVEQMIQIRQYDLTLYTLASFTHCLKDIPQSQSLSFGNIF